MPRPWAAGPGPQTPAPLGRTGSAAVDQVLSFRGFHHSLSWDARVSRPGCSLPPRLSPAASSPVPREAAAVPWGQASLLPPALEAVCNDSVPGLPGISNFIA